MKLVLKYLKKIGLFVSIIMIFCLFLSLLNLIGLSKNVTSTILFIFQIILFSIFGYIHGKKTEKKGFLEGLKVSTILIITMFLLSIILFNYDFRISNLIYYLIIILSSVLGAIFGKNKK